MNMPEKKPQKSLRELIDAADDVFSNFTRRSKSKTLYEEALKIAQEAQKEPETEYIQGKIDLVDEQWEDALKHFDRVISLDSNYFKAWHYRCFALGELSRYEEAIVCYDKVLEINPKYEPAWYNKGILLRRLGRYKEAIVCYDKALEINPKDESAKSNRNLALMRLGRVKVALKEREKLSSEKKEGIEKSKLTKEEKEERLLEIDARDAVINELQDKYRALLDAKRAYEKRLADSLKPRDEPLKDNFFLVLRRWNSYTPRMLTPTESNLGGGYFSPLERKRRCHRSGFRLHRQFLQ